MSARRCGTRGQGLAEFALAIPVFLVMVFGIIDAGRAIFAFNQASQMSRAVARVASTVCFTTTTACDESSGAIASAIASQSVGLQGTPTWTVDCINPVTGNLPTETGSDFCKPGYLVRVGVTTSFSLITPVASSFGPVNVGSSTDQEILQ